MFMLVDISELIDELDNISVNADMPCLCKKGRGEFGWAYYSATWKYSKGILLLIFHS